MPTTKEIADAVQAKHLPVQATSKDPKVPRDPKTDTPRGPKADTPQGPRVGIMQTDKDRKVLKVKALSTETGRPQRRSMLTS